jgi:hypothetical protein
MMDVRDQYGIGERGDLQVGRRHPTAQVGHASAKQRIGEQGNAVELDQDS